MVPVPLLLGKKKMLNFVISNCKNQHPNSQIYFLNMCFDIKIRDGKLKGSTLTRYRQWRRTWRAHCGSRRREAKAVVWVEAMEKRRRRSTWRWREAETGYGGCGGWWCRSGIGDGWRASWFLLSDSVGAPSMTRTRETGNPVKLFQWCAVCLF